jgi:hypothetical protein
MIVDALKDCSARGDIVLDNSVDRVQRLSQPRNAGGERG